MIKIAYALVWINFIALMVLGYLLFMPVKLSIVYNEPFPVYPEVVERGDQLNYIVEFEKTDDYYVETARNIVCSDGNLVTLSKVESDAPTGAHRVDAHIIIPEKVSDGSCYLQLDATYFINPIRTEHRSMQTQPFIVK